MLDLPKSKICLMSTYFLHCYIADLQYYEILEVWKKLEIGQLLELIAEPDNRYDKNAVIVSFKGKNLGYLPRSKNQAVSAILRTIGLKYIPPFGFC